MSSTEKRSRKSGDKKKSARNGSNSNKSPKLYGRRVLGQDATNYVMKAKQKHFEDSQKVKKGTKRMRNGKKIEDHLVDDSENSIDNNAKLGDGTEEEEADTCCICLDTITVRGKLDSCDHRYCFDCIKRWAKETNQCPQCKKRFTTLEKTVEGSDNNKSSPSSSPRGKKRRRKGKSNNVVKIKKKDIQVNHGQVHIQGLLQRIFNHFQMGEIGGNGQRRVAIRLRRQMPRTSSDNPIDLVDDDGGDDDNSEDGYIRREVEEDTRLGTSRISRVLDIRSLMQRMEDRGIITSTFLRNTLAPRAIDDGRGVSTETAISLLDSDDED